MFPIGVDWSTVDSFIHFFHLAPPPACDFGLRLKKENTGKN